jgi:uncharacterized repeat protein (TIGR04138 family)
MEELDFTKDSFEDILKKDSRYHPRAYVLLLEAVLSAMRRFNPNVSSNEIMMEFKEFTLDYFGPMSYSVLKRWGVTSTADLGQMMHNIVDSGRLAKSEDDNFDDFNSGYDFESTFLGPYETV